MNAPTLELLGMTGSVYTRIVQLVLAEKGLDHLHTEIDLFELPLPASYTAVHPFGRVPVLRHGDFTLYETQAISTYLDTAFPGPSLIPSDHKARARMVQVMSIIDAYAYWPMVRQVFVERVWNPASNLPADETAIAEGMQASRTVLRALEAIASEGLALTPGMFTRADAHLVPMIGYFHQAPEGAEALAGHPHLAAWWDAVQARPSVQRTVPPLP